LHELCGPDERRQTPFAIREQRRDLAQPRVLALAPVEPVFQRPDLALQRDLVEVIATSTEKTFDWQRILNGVQSTTTIASGLYPENNIVGDTTITTQLAKDFFGRYLLAQGEQTQNGIDTSQGLDSTVSNQIAEDTLSSAGYLNVKNVLYTIKNLNIQSNSSQETVKNYIIALQKNATYMQNSNIQTDEIDIINQAILTQDKTEITKLDPVIISYQTLLYNMLKTPIPQDVTDLHLEFVNSISAVLYDLQSIRNTFIDPVKSLMGLNSYKQDFINMSIAVEKLGSYAQLKMKMLSK
jgi:hypothetical protein